MSKMMPYIICPLCVHNLPIKRWGKGVRKYNIWDKEKDAIIYIRSCKGGKKPHDTSIKGPKPGWPPGTGFPIIERIPWDDALQSEEFNSYLQQMKEQIQKLAIQLLNDNEKRDLIKKLSKK